MANFSIGTMAELATALSVAPQEFDEIVRNRNRYYRIIQIQKIDGGTRTLNVPQDRLKSLQDGIRRRLLDRVKQLECVHGGVRGRSVITNSMPHLHKDVVFKLDIKDFFPTVGPRAVNSIFRVLGFGPEASQVLVEATTLDGQLPQGAPTSVALANLAMYRVDRRLLRLARLHGFDYTRFVDDLTLSGTSRLLGFRRLICRIVEEDGFTVNPKKLQTMLAGSRQIVTGIVVNDKPNLPKEQRDEIRRLVVKLASSEHSGVRIATVRGKLAWLAYVNPAKACRLQSRAPIIASEPSNFSQKVTPAREA